MQSFKNVSIFELDQFVKRSTLADKKEEVVQLLLYFLTQCDTNETIKQFIKTLLHDEEVLNKLVIVNEKDFYETAVTMTNRAFHEETTLQSYKTHAESIFLHVQMEGKSFTELKQWKNRYPNVQEEVINLLLDECILLREYNTFFNPRYDDEIKKWEALITLLLTEDEKEKNR